MDKRTVTIQVDEHGAITAVEVEGHPAPTGVVETTPSEPIRAFRDEEYEARPLPWLGV